MAACSALEILGLVLGSIGALGTFAATLMPQWKVTAHIGANILVAETRWEGLWMNCISQTHGVHVCENHMSVLALEPTIGVSRGLMCTACALSVIAFLMTIPGMRCFKYLGDDKQIKSKILLAAGVIFLLTGIIVLVPISWVANNIIKKFHDPAVPNSLKRELGKALYLGWITSAFLVSGGGILCSFCHHAKKPRRYISQSSNREQKPEHIKSKSESEHSYV